MLDGRLEGDGERLRGVPVDAVHLVRPRHPVLRYQPLPAPDVGDLLGLGELSLALPERSLSLLSLGDLAVQSLVGGGELGRPLPHPLLQLARGALQRLVGVHALRHHGGEEERAEGNRRVERLECEHPLEQRSRSERADALAGCPRGDGNDEQGRRRRSPLLEPPGRPPEQRDDEDHHVQIGSHRRQGHHRDEEEEHGRLDALPERCVRSVASQAQAEQERGHDEDAHGVAGPPHRPGGREPAGGQGSGRHQDPGPD